MAYAVEEFAVSKTSAKTTTRMGTKSAGIPARLSAKSVFEVDSSRLGIGVFNRPLLDDEVRRFRAAWEKKAPAGFEDYELDPERISFVSRPEAFPAAWDRIDAVLARATAGRTASKKVA
jgi:hypothetical protein